MLKDMIIRDDPNQQHMLRRIEEGDKNVLKEMLSDDLLSSSLKNSNDPMKDADLMFEYLNVNDDSTNPRSGSLRNNPPGPIPLEDYDSPVDPTYTFDGIIDKQNIAQKSGKYTSSFRNTRIGSLERFDSDRMREDSVDLGVRPGKSIPQPILTTRPSEEREHAGSFGLLQHMELFDFQLFDDGDQPSEATQGESFTDGNTGVNVIPRPVSSRLHRDSIAQLDDILLGGSNPVRFNSFNSVDLHASLDDDMKQSDRQDYQVQRHEISGSCAAERLEVGKKAQSRKINAIVHNSWKGNTNQYRGNAEASDEPPDQQSKFGRQYTSLSQTRGQKPADSLEALSTGGLSARKSNSSSTQNLEELSPEQISELALTVVPISGYIGGYSPDSRSRRIEKFLRKRHNRVWRKRVKYDVRKNFADSRLRVKGRFVKKEDEDLLRELIVMAM